MPESDAEVVKQLQSVSRVAATDAAQLGQLLRRACKLLGGVCHQQADNVVGVLVAVNESRLLSTIWPVLLQNLRDSSETKVKLTLLKHFACVADRIAIEQRINAFRVFATEALSLLTTIDVVIDNTFLRSFTLVLEALGVFAESQWCLQLLAAITKNLSSWSRPDALRAAANTAVTLVALTDTCGTLETLLAQAKNEFSPFAFALILDSSVPFFGKRVQLFATANAEPTDVPLRCVQQLVSDAMTSVFLDTENEGTNTYNSTLPSVISSYCRLKEVTPVSWNVAFEPEICRRVLLALNDGTTKKMFVTPLLRFLQLTNVRWWKKRGPVWSLAVGLDPLTRNEAFTALANSARSIDVMAASKTLTALVPLFSQYFAQGCISTVTGILKLLTILFSRLGRDKTHSLENSVFDLLCSTLTDAAENKVARNATVQAVFLNLCSASARGLNPRLLSYVKGCLTSESVLVRNAAVDALLDWCNHYTFNELDFTQSTLRAVDFFEGSFRLTGSSCKAFSATLDGFTVFRNYRIVFSCLLTPLFELPVRGTDVECLNSLGIACENLFRFCERTSSDSASAPAVRNAVCSSTMTQSLHSLLCGLLITGHVTIASVFSKVTTLYTESLRLSKSSTAEAFSLFMHKDIVNLVYNVLFLCCECVDPNAVASPCYEECVYFSKAILTKRVTKMIQLAAEASLTNKQPQAQTEFFHFIDDTLALLIQLIEVGANSPIFVGHLHNMYNQLIVCVDILAGSNPNSALKLICAIESVLFDSVNDVLPALQAEKEYLRFVTTVNCVLVRSLQFDLSYVGAELFRFATLVVRRDAVLGKGVCYGSLDPRGGLVEQAVRFVECRAGYRRGASAHEAALTFLLSLFDSPHHKALALQYCARDNLSTATSVIGELKDLFGSSRFQTCERLIAVLCEKVDEGISKPAGMPLTAHDDEPLQDRIHECFERLDVAQLNRPSYFFDFFEHFCDVFSGQKHEEIVGAMEKELPTIIWSSNVPLCICASAVDYSIVPETTEFILSASLAGGHPAFLFDVFTALLGCIPESVELRSIVAPSRLSDEVKKVATAYRWGCSFSARTEAAATELPGTDSAFPTGTNADLGDRNDSHRQCDELCKSPSLSVRGGSDEVSLALKQMSTGVCALSLAPLQLITDSALDSTTLAEIFECARTPAALELLGILLEEGNIHLFDSKCVIALAQCLTMRGPADSHDGDSDNQNVHSLQVNEVTLVNLQHQLLKTLHSHCVSRQNGSEYATGELSLVLRFSILILLWMVSPTALTTSALKDDHAASLTFEVVKTCCHATSSTKSVEELGKFVRARILVVTSQRHRFSCDSPIELSTLWLAALFCGDALWEDTIPTTATSPDKDSLAISESLLFLCQAAHTIGLPANLWKTIYKRYAPLLLNFGCGHQDASPDDQHMALWLIVSLVLQTPWAGDSSLKPTLHTSFSDRSCFYRDFPLESLETSPSGVVRRLWRNAALPFYKHRAVPQDTLSARHTNLHLSDLLLPLGRGQLRVQDQEKGKEAERKSSATLARAAGVPLLHACSRLMEELMSNTRKLPPFCVADVMTAAAVIAAGNTSFVRFAPASTETQEPVSSRIVHFAQAWLVQYGMEWFRESGLCAQQHPRQSVLMKHVGSFPGSTASLGFHDIVSITAVSVMLSCFSPLLDVPGSGTPSAWSHSSSPAAAVSTGGVGGPKHNASFSAPPTRDMNQSATPPQQPLAPPDIVAILDHMMGTDLFLYTTGLSSVVALSAASRRSEVLELTAIISHRVGDDLNAGRWGLLSVPFSLMQLLRASCAVLAVIPEERTSTKLCEGVWSGLLQRPWGSVLTTYGHYMVQCLMQITPAGGEGRRRRQWEMLRMLIMSTRPAPNADAVVAPMSVLPLWSTGYGLQSQQQKNLLAPHKSVSRRLSMSWSEGACVCGLSDEHAPAVQWLKERFLNQLELVTRATLILRSTVSGSSTTEERDRPGVQVADLLESVSSSASPLHLTGTELLCLEVLTESTMAARDSFFSIINHFDFSVASRRSILHELARILHSEAHCEREDGNIGDEVLGLLSIFFEAASRRASCDEHSWWLVVVLLEALLSVMNTPVSCALLSTVVVPQPAQLVKELAIGLALFYRDIPLHTAAVQLFTALQSSPATENYGSGSNCSSHEPHQESVTREALAAVLSLLTSLE